MRTTPLAVGLILLCFALPSASAHYLWVALDDTSGEHGVANIYFEEGPAAGNGEYLDRFNKTSKTWFRTVKRIDPQALEADDVRADNKRWLSAKLPQGAPRSVDCYGKFGVYNYGKSKVLLHYYARHLDVSTHEDLHELGRSEHMDLDITPHDSSEAVDLTVRWQGKPAVGRTVYIRGPKQFRKNLETDKNGRVRFAVENPGRYTFRTSVEEATGGREGDEDYDLIRHNATLIMTLPLKE